MADSSEKEEFGLQLGETAALIKCFKNSNMVQMDFDFIYVHTIIDYYLH